MDVLEALTDVGVTSFASTFGASAVELDTAPITSSVARGATQAGRDGADGGLDSVAARAGGSGAAVAAIEAVVATAGEAEGFAPEDDGTDAVASCEGVGVCAGTTTLAGGPASS